MAPKLKALLVLSLFFVNLGLSPAAAKAKGSTVTITLEHEGFERHVIAYIPSTYKPAEPVPLLFALHGGSGNGAEAFKRFGIPAEAERRGFIAVFPSGLPKPGGNPKNLFWSDPVNLGYIQFLIDVFETDYSIDASRVYVVGFSGGAKLSYGLAADPVAARRIAAIGTVAGENGARASEDEPWDVVDPAETDAAPVPAFMVQGALDEKLPIGGGWSEKKGEYVFSFQEKLDVWIDHLGAEERGPVEVPQAPADVEGRLWTNSDTGMSVVGVVDPELGHAWPRWNAIGAMWDFFERVPTR
jgi:polyhydroxybutyrate depolymerase